VKESSEQEGHQVTHRLKGFISAAPLRGKVAQEDLEWKIN
jgi:hypothetical protein